MSKLTVEELQGILDEPCSSADIYSWLRYMHEEVRRLADHLAALAEEKQCQCEQAASPELTNTVVLPSDILSEAPMEQTNYNIAELADWCEAMCWEGVAGAGRLGMPGVLLRYKEQLQPIAECLRNQAKMERESNALRAELSKLRGEDKNLIALVAKLTYRIEAYREDNEKLRAREAAIQSGDAVAMRKYTLEKWLKEDFRYKGSTTQWVSIWEWGCLKRRAGKE